MSIALGNACHVQIKTRELTEMNCEDDLSPLVMVVVIVEEPVFSA